MTNIMMIISKKPRKLYDVSKPKSQNMITINPKKWDIKHSFLYV